MKFRIKENTFKGETYQQYNGIVVTKEQKNGEDIIGRSGKTKAYATMAGGRLYLSDDQIMPE